MNQPKHYLASILILFVAFLFYGALFPFHGWRIPTTPVLSIVLFDWIDYIFLFDIVQNLLLFLPFGILAGSYLATQKKSRPTIILMPIVASLCVSLTIEVLQTYNPARLPSLLDVSLNTMSGALGALLSLPFMRYFERFSQNLHQYIFFTRRNNLWPLFGLTIWLVWGCYQLFPYIPTLHPRQLLEGFMPLWLFFKGEYPFYADRFFLHALQGSTLYFSGKLFLKPLHAFGILLSYVSLVLLGQLAIVDRLLTAEMVFGCAASILLLYAGQKIIRSTVVYRGQYSAQVH